MLLQSSCLCSLRNRLCLYRFDLCGKGFCPCKGMVLIAVAGTQLGFCFFYGCGCSCQLLGKFFLELLLFLTGFDGGGFLLL